MRNHNRNHFDSTRFVADVIRKGMFVLLLGVFGCSLLSLALLIAAVSR